MSSPLLGRSAGEFDLNFALTNYVVCQKRTGRNKQFVFLVGDKVFKGPFSEEKAKRVFSISQQTKLWNTPFVVHPLPEIYTSPQGYFLTFENLAKDYPVETDLNRESFSSYEYRVLKRSDLYKLGDKVLEAGLEWAHPMYPWLVLAYCHLFLLDVGDTHLANTLVDTSKQRIYLIDYEDRRANFRDDEFFYMTMRPAKKKVEVLGPLILKWYGTIAEELSKLLLSSPDPTSWGRIKYTMDLLRKYAIERTLTLTISPTNLGKMEFKGLMGGSVTFSGYRLDVMKSALQKYIRRNMPVKALMAAFELYRMAEFPNGRALQSNMYNRLAIIAGEDIGPANLGLMVLVTQKVMEDQRRPEELAAMVQLLCASEKTRIMSQYNRAYFKPEGLIVANSLGIQINDQFTQEDLDALGDKSPKVNFWLPGDPEEIKPFAEVFFLRLRNHDVRCFIWLRYFMQAVGMYNPSTGEVSKPTVKVVKRRRRDNPMGIIWDILRQVLDSRVIDVFEPAFYKFREDRVFLMAAITAALHEEVYVPTDMTSLVEQWRGNDLLSKLMVSDYSPWQMASLKVDDFAIDMHTKEGRKKGADRKKFVEEGSLVSPQSQKYFNETYEKLYKTV